MSARHFWQTYILFIAICKYGFRNASLLWEAHGYYGQKKGPSTRTLLFKEQPTAFTLPTLEDSWLEQAIDERELIGFTLCSPFALLLPSEQLSLSPKRAKTLRQLLGQEIVIEGYLVTVKPTRTVGGKEMNFGTWLDQDGHFFDSIHFPPIVGRYPFKGRGVYRIWGLVTHDFGVVTIEVKRQQKLGIQTDPRGGVERL